MSQLELPSAGKELVRLVAALNGHGVTPRGGDVVRRIFGRCVWAHKGFHGGPCLEWQGPDSGSNGRGHSYPRMNLDGQTVAVHRCLWVCLNGYLPGKKQLDHLCKNRRCVLHCEPVTHKENQRRRDAK